VDVFKPQEDIMKINTPFVATLFTLILTLSSAANAADTTEPFELGASDFEFYVGLDGIGKKEYEKEITADALLGYGFTKKLSGYVGVGGASDEYFVSGGGYVSLGLYGNVVGSDHFKLDLFLDATYETGGFGITPMIEMNVDLDPDMNSWGAYLRVAEVLAGRDDGAPTQIVCDPNSPRVSDGKLECEEEDGSPNYTFAPSTELLLGTYYTVTNGHQLLLEFNSVVYNNPEAGQDSFEVGGIAVGYNVAIANNIELINTLFFDIPQSGEDFAMGLNIGIIVTVPVGKMEEPESK